MRWAAFFMIIPLNFATKTLKRITNSKIITYII